MNRFSKIIVTLFGLGFFPIAPGTIGSIFSIIFFYQIINSMLTISLLILFILTILISLFLIEIYSSNKNEHDAPEIVIDEFLGIYLIIIFYDYIKFSNDIIMFTFIFFLFRFFDIVKIYPANWIDKNIKNSFGIILDDLVAGLYCIIVLFILNVFI